MSVETFSPTPLITSFDDLVRVAAEEGPNQTLLVVLVKVDRVHQANEQGEEVPLDNEGSLSPHLVRHFPWSPQTDLADIVRQADEASEDWEFMMMAVLPPMKDRPYTEDELDGHLTRMAQNLMSGENLGQFAFFTREGDPIEIRSASS